METIRIDEVLKSIAIEKLRPFSIGFCLPKTGEMIDLKEALSWKYVKGKFDYVVDGNIALKMDIKPKEPRNSNLRLIVDINSGNTYNIFIDLIDRFNNKEVFF